MTTAPPEEYRLVVVDDVREIREILAFLLEETGWFRVVGLAGDCTEAIDVVTSTEPDIVVVDAELFRADGWEVVAELQRRAPDTAVVVLRAAAEGPQSPDDVRGNAAAVFDKGMAHRDLVAGLLEVAARRRGRWWPPIGEGEAGAERPEAVDASPAAAPEAWLAALVSASIDGVIAKALDGTILAWSPAAERIHGWTAEEMIGRNISLIVPADRREELVGLLARLRAGERIDRFETVRIRKDGARVDVQLTLVPVVDQDGRVIGTSTVARDISSRRHAEGALVRAVAQLERKNRELQRSNDELDQFASVASHDLAQPLQVAFGFVEMVRASSTDRLTEDEVSWLDNAVGGLERMRSLVRDILSYARTGSGEPAYEAVELGGVVQDALGALDAMARDRNAIVDIGPLPAVVGDAGQLSLVFQNLLANAIKFVPTERRPLVRVSGWRLDGDAVVSVVDNGPGVPADQRDAVFEMFHRGGGGDRLGTGLGLAIVKKIVGRHGGAVWVEDAPGEGGGTAVLVRLPSVGEHDE